MLASVAFQSKAQKSFQVDVSKKGAEISPSMWGVFFEDINFGADGGIYAELVKNRSFEFLKPWMGWKRNEKPYVEGQFQIVNQPQNSSNPRYLAVKLNSRKKGELGITNEGFRGMGLKKDLVYDFSTFYRVKSGSVKIYAELLDEEGKIIGTGESKVLNMSLDDSWAREEFSFKSNATVSKGKLNIWFEGNGEVHLDIISLFPTDTWKGRKGGMRADMVQKLADLKPGFIRFPGGCIVEGFDLDNRYQWKKTIGSIEERQLIMNRWNVEFPHKNAPDYFQTFGLGFFEYFQLAEDLGAEPLPIISCGIACQFNSGEVVELSELEPYVQDALDLIEFANGDINSRWGRERAKMGHPEPFNLKYIGIGNENWGPQYVERFEVFQKAFKEKYPEIELVASTGPYNGGDWFNLLNDEFRKLKVDIIDEHSYAPPRWFFNSSTRYDNYDRNGPKIFVGEWAAHTKNQGSDQNVNNWLAALSESAFMTGLERNADIVRLSSYAPLFGHVDAWQWSPDLIWVDNLNTYGTPNYYIQKLFSTNKGTNILKIEDNGAAITGKDSVYASAVWDSFSKELIVKITNGGDKSIKQELKILGAKKLASKASISRMQSDNLEAMNSIEEAFNISPKESEVSVNTKQKNLILDLPSRSFSVYKIKVDL